MLNKSNASLFPLTICRSTSSSGRRYVMRGASSPRTDESSPRSWRHHINAFQQAQYHSGSINSASSSKQTRFVEYGTELRVRQPVRRYTTRTTPTTMDTIKNTIAENFGGDAAKKLGTHQFSLDDTPDLTNKVAVVTGGSEGIGYGITYTLLKHNIAKLFILSVSKEVVDGAKASIAKELGQESADRTVWLQCDLSDWKQTKEVAEEIKNQTDRLDILVNNAGRGIMTYQLTDYGVDRHMALNHMGHVVLTSHLLPLMKKTAESGDIVRITNQASNAHQAAPKDTKFESLEELNQDLGPNGQYGRSKLASILYARYFARKVTNNGHPNVLMNATHPGFVSTKMSKDDIHEPYPLGGYAMSAGMEPFKKDQFEGAVSSVYAATAINESGKYICPPAVPEPGSELAQDDELADRLMELTRKVVTEKTRSDSTQQGCPMDDLVLH